ncbi:hypothetical protein ACWENQ_16090 [Nonomuraea sp. NPDC004354]
MSTAKPDKIIIRAHHAALDAHPTPGGGLTIAIMFAGSRSPSPAGACQRGVGTGAQRAFADEGPAWSRWPTCVVTGGGLLAGADLFTKDQGT